MKIAPDRPSRLEPLAPPYTPELETLLTRMTPPKAPETLALFRVLAHNPLLAERANGWGAYLLGRKASLSLRDREVVIDRVCVRCGAEYEWGVHVAAFSEAARFTPEQTSAIASKGNEGHGFLTANDQLLVRMVDELHDSSDVSDALWAELAAVWSPAQLIELLMLAGWYHAISYVCNAARVPIERWGARWPQ